MPRPGVTKQEVANAVTALRAAGRPTTTRVVRLEVGRGSYATISKYLEQLGAKSQGRSSSLPELPQDLQLRLADCVLNMWQAMSTVAVSDKRAVELQCERRIHTLSEQVSAERTHRRRLEAELAAALADNASLKGRNEALELGEATLRERLAVEQALLRRSEEEGAKLRGQLDSLLRLSPVSAPSPPRKKRMQETSSS